MELEVVVVNDNIVLCAHIIIYYKSQLSVNRILALFHSHYILAFLAVSIVSD